jgi:hypothetical protein
MRYAPAETLALRLDRRGAMMLKKHCISKITSGQRTIGMSGWANKDAQIPNL